MWHLHLKFLSVDLNKLSLQEQHTGENSNEKNELQKTAAVDDYKTLSMV